MTNFVDLISHTSLRKRQAKVVAVVVFISLTAIAYASIPDSNGTIHGCYKKSGGTVRLIDDATAQCDSRAETPIEWNQTGPQGPMGPTGPIGPQGPAGISSASRATGTAELHTGEYSQVLSKDLPVGNWVISARTTVGVDRQSYEPAIFAFNCEVRSGNTVIGAAQDWDSTQAQLVSHTLPLNGLVTLTENGTVSVWCKAQVSDSGFASGGASSEMTIIQVGSVF